MGLLYLNDTLATALIGKEVVLLYFWLSSMTYVKYKYMQLSTHNYASCIVLKAVGLDGLIQLETPDAPHWISEDAPGLRVPQKDL